MTQKNTFKAILIIALLISNQLFAQTKTIQHLEPPNWWVGMKNTNLQLLVHADNIGNSKVVIDSKLVKLKKIQKVANTNYLFINLEIGNKAGTFDILFKENGETIANYSYELKEKSKQSRGFDQSDLIYLLMPDRFSNGSLKNDNAKNYLEKADRTNPNGRHGGDIQGIINRLDYIKSIGVTTIWVNPLVENNMPSYSYHGYAITDFYKIDPRYGSNADYKRLSDICHEKDLKIIMDMVFNHSGSKHWWMRDLPTPDWIHQFSEFTRSNYRASVNMDIYASDFDKTKMLTGWFDHTMPDLNQQNLFLATYLIQNSLWWIEFAGLDGIRLDTQPYSYKEFITEWAKTVYSEYPDFRILGESWLQKEAYTAYFQKDTKNADGYNSNIPTVTDFPLYFALNAAFNEQEGWTQGLARLYYVLGHDYLYANASENVIFLDNHDLNRFYSAMGKDLRKFKMGIAYLLTTRGIPMIYYGTEILMDGLEHEGHGFIRKDFPGGWTSDQKNAFTTKGRTAEQIEAFNYLQKIALWRKNNPVIHEGKLLHFIPENNCYVFFRYTNKKAVMVVMNNHDSDQKIIKLDRFSEILKNYKQGKEISNGDLINLTRPLKIPAKSALIFELQ